jgi:hypothetical protein
MPAMPREKRDATYTILLNAAIKDTELAVEDAANLIGVKVDTLKGWLYLENRAEVPKWAYDLFVLHARLERRDAFTSGRNSRGRKR